MDAHDLLRNMLKGMGVAEEKINDTLAGPSLKVGLEGFIPAPIQPSKESLAEAKAAMKAVPVIPAPPLGIHLGEIAQAEFNAQSIADAITQMADAIKQPQVPAVSNGKYSNLKHPNQFNHVETHAMTIDKQPIPMTTTDPLVNAKTPVFEFTFTAKPVVVRVQAKNAEEAEQRAGSLFDPLGAEWELTK